MSSIDEEKLEEAAAEAEEEAEAEAEAGSTPGGGVGGADSLAAAAWLVGLASKNPLPSLLPEALVEALVEEEVLLVSTSTSLKALFFFVLDVCVPSCTADGVTVSRAAAGSTVALLEVLLAPAALPSPQRCDRGAPLPREPPVRPSSAR